MNKIPFYFPFANGLYEVKPGLFPLDTDFGNNAQDHHIFQIDSNHHEYILKKKQILKKNVHKHFCHHQPSLRGLVQLCHFIAIQLSHEYPEYFTLVENDDHFILQIRNRISLYQPEIYIPSSTVNADINQMLSVVNALMLQIQEDIAFTELDQNGEDYISLLHLCYPNHWSAEEKIGKNFTDAHNPVPGIASINNRSKQILRALINKGPFVRFAWGLSIDQNLNQPPPTTDNGDLSYCRENRFNASNPKLFLRVERQTTTGFRELNCFLFTIRTYFYDVADLKNDLKQREALSTAIQSMSEASLKYKGLDKTKNEILIWLNSD